MSAIQPWCAKSHRTPTERKWYKVNESIYNPLKISTRPNPVFPRISMSHSDRMQKRFFELFYGFIVYTDSIMIHTNFAMDINVLHYLEDVLRRDNCHPESHLTELFPDNWKKAESYY